MSRLTTQRDDLIIRAYKLLGLKQWGNDLYPEDLEDGIECLNDLINLLQEYGVYLWRGATVSYPMTASSQRLGVTDGLNYTCRKSHLAAAATADTEPGAGANWQEFWIQDGEDATIDWTITTIYTSIGDFSSSDITDGDSIILVDRAWLRVDGKDRSIRLISKKEFQDIETKYSEGDITHLYVDYGQSQTTYLNFHTYPYLDDTDKLLFLEVQKAADKLTAASDYPEIPSSWIIPMAYLLASLLGDIKQVNPTRLDGIKRDATGFLKFITGKTKTKIKGRRKKGAMRL